MRFLNAVELQGMYRVFHKKRGTGRERGTVPWPKRRVYNNPVKSIRRKKKCKYLIYPPKAGYKPKSAIILEIEDREYAVMSNLKTGGDMEFSTSNYLIENGENEKDFSIIDFLVILQKNLIRIQSSSIYTQGKTLLKLGKLQQHYWLSSRSH